MDLLADLNPQQRLAVEHGQGPALVLAGAGSGKTRVITYRIAHLILNAATRPENILAVTFTNKAAKEMRERVQSLLGPLRTAEPLICTFHSFCVRLLRREVHHLKYNRDFSIYDRDDQLRLLKQILREMVDTRLELSPRQILGRISYAKNHSISPERYAFRFPSKTAEIIEDIYRAYDSRLRQSNSLDFDDLLLTAVAVLEKEPELRRHYSDWYRYLLVDEYQDTNQPQYQLLRLLTAAHNNLFVVGDEDQSIYKFRGADIQNILKFEEDFPGARIIKLEQNYRSTQNILHLAGAVVANNIERKGKYLWTENVSGDVGTCCREESPRQEAIWIAGQIRNILNTNPDYRIAVLYRANFLSRNFEEVFTDEKIPYAVVGSVAFFGRMEVKDTLAYLRVVTNPEDDVALLRIINTPPRAIGSTTIKTLTQAALERGIPIYQVLCEKAKDPQCSTRASRALRQFQEMTERWSAIRDTVSTAQLLETILEDTRYREMLGKQESAAEAGSRVENIEELIRAAAESESKGETVLEFLDRASLSSELDHLNDNATVAFMTLHSAKGLEFDVVFIAGMEEGLFPHGQSLNTKDDLEEERRLCYVGITRAKKKLFLTWTPFRRSYGASAGHPARPSRFLEEMPIELLEGFDTRMDYPSHRQTSSQSHIDEDAKNYETVINYPSNQADSAKEPSVLPKTLAELRAYLQHKQHSAKSAAQPPRTGVVFKSGMRVRHAEFGDGIIISRNRVGNRVRLTIIFSELGKKILIEKYAKLEALSKT